MTQQLTTERELSIREVPDETLTAVRSWPSGRARTWTINALADAKRNVAIEAIVASGSAVRNVECSDDLDLVLVYRKARPSLPRPPIDVDLRQFEQSEVLRNLETGHDYLSWTVRYGKALFERDAWWSRLRADWNERLVPPSATEARDRARRTQHLYDEMCAVGDRDAAAELNVSILTQLARAALCDAGVLPQSRLELADQLRNVNKHQLADSLTDALAHRYG